MERMKKQSTLSSFGMMGLVLLAICFIPAQSYADTPAPNEAYRAESLNGQFYIEMKPQDGWGGYGEGGGIAYGKQAGGQVKEIWRVNFFSSEVYLTNDGHHLIAFGPWASEMSDMAIAFYKDGQELERYAIGDLIEDESKLQKSVSHVFWQDIDRSTQKKLSQDEKKFSVPIAGGKICIFDVSTGALLEKK